MHFLSESYKNRLKELAGMKSLLTESMSGKHLVIVDVQPEYADGFGNMHYNLVEFIHSNWDDFSDVTFLYNGADTLGMISEWDYKMWWMEAGMEEYVIDQATWYDKGYAFFRYCMDSGIDHEDVANLVREMMAHDVNDSRDLDEEFWNDFVERHGAEDLRDLMEISDDCIHIPDLMDELRGYNNIVICGGGANECLAEVEIALEALGKSYTTLNQFVYEE